MALAVGTDSYVTVAEYTARAVDMGWALTGDQASQEADLRKGAMVVDLGRAFLGRLTDNAQEMAWPREGVRPANGYSVTDGETPLRIKSAQMEAAFAIQNGFDPFAPVNRGVKSVNDKAGPLADSVEYFAGETAQTLPSVEAMLKPFLASTGAVQRLVRA